MTDSEPVDPPPALEAERGDVRELRRVAEERRQDLERLRRQRSVRIALALERRTKRARTRAFAAAAAIRERSSRLALAAAALPRRRATQFSRSDHAKREAAHELEREPRVPAVVVSVDPATADIVTVGRAIEDAASDLVCLILTTTRPVDENWLTELSRHVRDDVAAACPMLIHPRRSVGRATPHDLRVRSLGYEIVIVGRQPQLRAVAAGTDPSGHREPVEVAAGSAACLVFDRRAYRRAGGLTRHRNLDAAVVDLCGRIRAQGSRIVAVPGAHLVDERPVANRRALTQPLSEDAWREVIEQRGAALTRTAARMQPAQMRFSITVAAPSAKVADRWGDWHLAEALARALARRGHRARVNPHDDADSLQVRSADVHVVVRGVAPVRRSPGQRYVLWVISHPESISDEECDAADLVLVASERFAAELRRRTTTPVELFLQATDHERFRPLPADARHAHEVAVVAKTRDVLRPIVRDAIAADLRPAIYGSGWSRYVDPGLVVANHIPNDELPIVYSSVGVLLNDHWDTMRAWGFVSNRLFDALACGTPVISDDLPEMHDLFDDAIATYAAPDELKARVDEILRDPAAARRRAEHGRQMVLANHTFDHRAESLLELLARYNLVDHGPEVQRNA